MAAISQLTGGELTTLATGDLFAVVDVSDDAESLNGTTKKITIDNVAAGVVAVGAVQTQAITDTGGYFTTDTVEAALQELGAAVSSSASILDPDADTLVMWDDSESQLIGYPLTKNQAFTEAHATSHTLSADECYGGVYYVTAASVILTLPAVAAGMSLTVISMTANAVTVNPNDSDKIYLEGTALDDGDSIISAGNVGDIAVLTYYSADGWVAITNTGGSAWADNS